MSKVNNNQCSKLILENINDIIWILDPSSLHFSFVTDSSYTMLGFLPEEMMKKELRDVLVKKSYVKILECIGRKLFDFTTDNPRAQTIEMELIGKKRK